MYQEYFGLTEKPFSETPNSKFFYLSAKHREGLAHLEYNILDGKGFTVLIGEVGTGKTTLCKAFVERLDTEKNTVAYVIHTNLDFHEFLREVVDELGISAQSQQKWDLLKALKQYLIEAYRQKRKVILIVDEAQNLTPSVLEGIRMLSNLETPQGKLIQIVFVGQPGLMEHIQRPDMLQLKQRIAGSFCLGPLSQRETHEYIAFRLNSVQAKPPLRFTSEALDLVYELSSGIPRLINFLCDFSLIHAYVAESWTVDPFLVQKAYKDLMGSRSVDEPKEEKEKRFPGRFRKVRGREETKGMPVSGRFSGGQAQFLDADLLEEAAGPREENFFFPEKKSLWKKMAVAFGLILALGGLVSLVFWMIMNLEKWSPRTAPPAYQIKRDAADPERDLQSGVPLSEKRLDKMNQESND